MKKSFTLIELMIVVIIIGVLAGIVAPRLVGRAEKAKQEVARSAVSATIPAALDLYDLDVGSYPENLEDLVNQPSGAENWDGPYLKKIPKDPWDRDYHYDYPGEHGQDYDLASSGRDGILGSEDDIVSWE
ncbi:MAG: type II secretion system major pseudopilin GspG [Candidatus Omnitrophota bacterium]|nr:MAG: type II secretion system major pseudopilin GspG [Candidatus Omnitrophota bacterium]